MKAIVYHNYGSPDVLELKEVAKPIPADDEVLIKVAAVSGNRSDWRPSEGNRCMPASGGFSNHVTRYSDRTSPGELK